ncbi:hypothetical protein WH50_24920 [Pokkaliibacter plantistimulans]|uniref:Major facilitator superfamily (MFS) profile domain-containing protein n=1 Tax=Pokkaliibacter plantistimulans TaxID=1635171 RepID=A0ABX5LVF9_9GAMM|nr:MDR family MFS transporter [Pokkaliibacter plantistimulans]PXF28695.1 hypothetical protein WH50_24920 [Pokkaliibacter plantistimulans]
MYESLVDDPLEALKARYGTGYRLRAMLTVMLGTLSVLLASTMINVAIPQMMTTFHVAQTEAQWLVTGFLACMTASMLASAWFLREFGQRGSYVICIGLFALAAVLGGLSSNFWLLVLSRCLQGAMAGVIQPLGIITIYKLYPPEKRGTGMGIYGLGVILGPALGPALGGGLVDAFGWQSIFFASLPIAALALVMALRYMPKAPANQKPMPLDILGLIILLAAILGLLWAFSNGKMWGWSHPAILFAFAVALLGGLSFIWRCKTTAHPLVHLDVFNAPGVWSCTLITLCLGASLYGSTYLIPLFSQQILHFTPTESGLLLMPAGIASALMFPVAGVLADRLPPYLSIMLGMLLFALSCLLFALIDQTAVFLWLVTIAIIGRVGISLIFPALNTGTLRLLPAQMLASGAALFSFIRQLGSAVGVNGVSIWLDWRQHLHHSQLQQGNAEQLWNNALSHYVYSWFTGHEQLQMLCQQDCSSQLNQLLPDMLGFSDSFLSMMLIALLILIPAWRLRTHIQPRPRVEAVVSNG